MMKSRDGLKKLWVAILCLVVFAIVVVVVYGAARRHAQAISCGNQAHVILFTACYD